MALFDTHKSRHPRIIASQKQNLTYNLDETSLVGIDVDDEFGGEVLMGRTSNSDADRPILSLVGNFRFCDPDGRAIRIPSKKARTLLVMLATSRDRRRSREWLRSRLWDRSPEAYASSSLRQALSALRQTLNHHSDVVQADYDYVWLEGVDIHMDPGSDTHIEFFEDAPNLGEAGEDWLREERQAFAARVQDAQSDMMGSEVISAIAPGNIAALPCILIGNPVVVSDDVRASVIAERIATAIENTFRQNGYVETYDLRDLTSNQVQDRDVNSLSRPPVLVEVRTSLLGEELQVSIVARIPATGKVIWTSSISNDCETATLISSETMMEFVMGAVDSIESLILRQSGRNTKPTLYTAVHQLFGLSRDGIRDARSLLRQLMDETYSANTEAWFGVAAMFMLGEGHGDDDRKLGQANEHIKNAISMSPSNAMVLAIAGHFTSFVHRDHVLASDYLAQSRRLVPNLAFAWDATAMNAIYTGDLNTGASAAEIARNLGRYSPYKFYYDASAAIVATLQEKHEDAIRIGNQVLSRRPDFLPVMRHMFASLVMINNTSAASAMYQRIRELDPEFGTKAMALPSYVLPSERSREVINNGLLKMGLIEG
ncbi:hypothetical protein [Roseovarius sp. EL26]|uniref:hypothetical protein n=1 Tax=Roseovarius sp. EL26 TaxID=2126672 RepID=UPI000EA377DD|nr:hypothetical protein [Roseovarius sp. EL26]